MPNLPFHFCPYTVLQEHLQRTASPARFCANLSELLSSPLPTSLSSTANLRSLQPLQEDAVPSHGWSRQAYHCHVKTFNSRHAWMFSNTALQWILTTIFNQRVGMQMSCKLRTRERISQLCAPWKHEKLPPHATVSDAHWWPLKHLKDPAK